jgi:hypothetical protein
MRLPESTAVNTAGEVRRVTAVDDTGHPLLAPALVGRELELAALDAALAGAAAGHGRVVLVAGDAGVGKSALSRAFLAHARLARVGVLIGECSEVGAARPFAPFVEILRSALETFPPDVVERSLQTHAHELLRFVPERTSRPLELSSLTGERFQSHESFAMFFADLARSKPVVLAVEDVHFADPATLELLPYLLRRLRDERALIILTYRRDELHRLHPLRPVLAELERSPETTGVRLRPLDGAETSRMIQSALGLSLPPAIEFRRAIDTVCEGNPFFIEEVLRTLAQRGDLVYGAAGWHPGKEVRDIVIPDSVHGAVDQRVLALTADAQRVLRVAAVIGRRFQFDVLQRVSELPERTVLDALSAALDTQLIVQAGDPRDDQFAFRHALTREAILAGLLQREQRSLHRAIGAELERRAGGDPATAADALAYHFDEAGDTELALHYHEIAASEATRVFAFAAAAGHLDRACALAPHEPRMLATLHMRLSESARLGHDYRRGCDAAETARAHYVALGDAAGVTAALTGMANCEIGRGNLGSAERFADEAVRAGDPLADGPELAEALRTAAFVAWMGWNWAKVHETGEQAIRLARKSGATGALVQAMTLVGATMAQEGNDDAGLTRIREAIAIGVERGVVPEAEFAMFFLGSELRALGAPRLERRAAFEERLRYCRERGYRNDVTLASEIELAFVDGEWDRVSRLATDLRDTIYATVPALIAAFVGAGREGPGLFREHAMDVRRRMLASSQGWTRAASSTAALFWLAGDARATLEQAAVFADLTSPPQGQGHPGLWAPPGHLGPVAMYALLAAERLDDAAAIERWTALMSRDVSAREPHALTAVRLFARARRADREGKLESALTLPADVEPLLVEGELPFALTVTRLERADLLLRRGASGDRKAAADELAALVPYWQRAKSHSPDGLRHP